MDRPIADCVKERLTTNNDLGGLSDEHIRLFLLEGCWRLAYGRLPRKETTMFTFGSSKSGKSRFIETLFGHWSAECDSFVLFDPHGSELESRRAELVRPADYDHALQRMADDGCPNHPDDCHEMAQVQARIHYLMPEDRDTQLL